MHINQEYAIYMQAESEDQDFVIAKTVSNLFCILENCFIHLFFRKLSDDSVRHWHHLCNLFWFHAVMELRLGKPAMSANVTAELADDAKLWADCSLKNRFWLES